MVRGLFFVVLLGGAAAEPPQTVPKKTGSSDIPELKPLLWKHSGRKVHDPWKQYCGSTYCYDVLEVPKDATKQQITKSYHKLSREWHPDKVSFLILHDAVSFFFHLTHRHRPLRLAVLYTSTQRKKSRTQNSS